MLSSEKLSDILSNEQCSVIEGEVERFNSPSVGGHEAESFYIGNEFFSYSNELTAAYSKTKVLGGCIRNNGQKLRISYIKQNGENVIFKIEELKKSDSKPYILPTTEK